MLRGGEHGHVSADLRDQDLRGGLADTGNGRESPAGINERGDLGVDLGVDPFDEHLEVIDVSEVQAKHRCVMLTEAADESPAKLDGLEAQPFLREVGQHDRVSFTSDQRVDHQPARHRQGLRRDRSELDPRVFENLLDPLTLTGPVLWPDPLRVVRVL